MKEAINRKGIWVGIFIVVGLMLLTGAVLTIGNLRSTFQRKIVISTIFEDVDGLQAGNNIWFSGVKIGTVKDLEFYGESKVKVLLNINKEARQYIRKNSKVKISTDGLIGNKIIVIYGGDTDSPEIEEGDQLANESMLSTDDILLTLQENNLNILAMTKKLSEGQGTLGKLISSDSLYISVLTTARSLERASSDARGVINSLSIFSKKLNKQGTLVNDLITDTTTYRSVKASVHKLEHVMDTINILVSDLKKAGKNPKSPVGVLLHDEEAGKHLKETLHNLEKSSETLNEDLEALQHNFLFRRFFKKKKAEENKQKKSAPDPGLNP